MPAPRALWAVAVVLWACCEYASADYLDGPTTFVDVVDDVLVVVLTQYTSSSFAKTVKPLHPKIMPHLYVKRRGVRGSTGEPERPTHDQSYYSTIMPIKI